MRPPTVRSFVSSVAGALLVVTLMQVPTAAIAAPAAAGHVATTAAERRGDAQVERRRPGHPKHLHQSRRHGRHTVKIATYNLRAGMGMEKFRHGVRAIRRNAGVIGLQEIGANSRRHFLHASRHWGYFRPRYIQQNPVIWDRRKFHKVKARGHRIAKSRHLRGQLPGSRKPKKHSTATVVRLRHKASGRRLSVINVHLVHGAVKGGKPWPGRPRVFGLYVDQVRGVVRVVRKERRWGRVFVVGDFNVGYRADKHVRLPKLPYRRLKRLHLNSMWQGTKYVRHRQGTRRDALIDQVWSKRKASRAKVLRGIEPSDHYPAVATYRLKPASRHR